MEVSVITPTYQRRAFIPALIEIYRHQTYPKHKMEWLILDDGRDSVRDVFEEASKTIPNIRYVHLDEKMRIGAKRNWLNQHASGRLIIAMDDDDYYPPTRIQHVVDSFRANPRVQLAGSSEMMLYDLRSKRIRILGPYGPKHATNGTMAWRKSYSDTHRYDEFVTKGEESSFLEGYRHPMIQLDPKQTILVMCHSDNTVNKSTLQDHIRETSLSLLDIVKEDSLRAFYDLKGIM
jgi:glycosyltransferase involved in cell wall biosynthesis